VLFIDEVEEIASKRDGRPVTHFVTNELLRVIPLFRERPRHVLVCAANWIHTLDSAFLRPGRFDYLIPVGPSDEAARRAIWPGYVLRMTEDQVDLDRLVMASELFTPAEHRLPLPQGGPGRVRALGVRQGRRRGGARRLPHGLAARGDGVARRRRPTTLAGMTGLGPERAARDRCGGRRRLASGSVG
jgi:hypothetical protein